MYMYLVVVNGNNYLEVVYGNNFPKVASTYCEIKIDIFFPLIDG